MSVLNYNGIALPYTNTSRFDQVVVRDPSNTDSYMTRFDIQVQTVFTAAYLKNLDSSIDGSTTNAAEIMAAVRGELIKPRKQLSFVVDGAELIPQPTAGRGFVDAANGPVPQSCNIIQLSSATFLVTYHIVAHYFVNPSVDAGPPLTIDDLNGNPVLNNRWSESVDIDECNFSTLVRDGVFIIRSDNTKGFIADELRTQMAVLSTPNGFLRHSANYTVSPDGLSIRYKLRFREAYKMPPSPAFTAEGTYTESANRFEAMRFGEVRVVLKGDKSAEANQAVLVRRAVDICSRKLEINGAPLIGPVEKRGVVQEAYVSVGMYENRVEALIRAMFPFQKKRIDGIAFLKATMCNTPLSDDVLNTAPGYLDRGTAGIVLQAAAYYDPSLVNLTVDKSTGKLTQGLEVGRAGVQRE